jgi:hypothetical protein
VNENLSTKVNECHRTPRWLVRLFGLGAVIGGLAIIVAVIGIYEWLGVSFRLGFVVGGIVTGWGVAALITPKSAWDQSEDSSNKVGEAFSLTCVGLGTICGLILWLMH